MAVRNIRSIKPKHWVPPIFSANHKITITRDDGTVDDITDICHFFEYDDGVTEMIGRFSLEIWTPNETYTGVWTGMEIVQFYNDYAATSTSLRFRGRIEKPKYANNKIRVDGRSDALFFMEKTVTKSFTTTECSQILKSLIDSYSTGFTYTNVNVSSVSLTVNWYQKPFWDCVKELTQAPGFDCYIDSSLDFHFFLKGSVTNTGEAIVHDHNEVMVDDFVEDITFVKNRIIVYGAVTDGIQLMYTAEDSTSQTAYGVREEIINDDNITSYTQAQEYGNYILAQKKDPPQIGEVKGSMLATIQPGEKIRLSSPDNNLPPGTYNILSFKQTINFERGFYTTVRVNKEPRKISHIMKSIVESNNQQKQVSINPEEMRYSFNFLFDTDEGTHTNTEIADGVLRPTAGTGTWISPTRTLTSNIIECYPLLNGTTMSGAIVSVSGNGGIDYEVLTHKTKLTLSTALGTTLKIKVVFSDATTEVHNISLLYKLE